MELLWNSGIKSENNTCLRYFKILWCTLELNVLQCRRNGIYSSVDFWNKFIIRAFHFWKLDQIAKINFSSGINPQHRLYDNGALHHLNQNQVELNVDEYICNAEKIFPFSTCFRSHKKIKKLLDRIIVFVRASFRAFIPLWKIYHERTIFRVSPSTLFRFN